MRPPGSQADTAAAEALLKAKMSRKRTKTGCLTCRKRRIKCGEEKPICSNCVKSKRICQGYNQRVVFRPPTFEYQAIPNNGGAHITFQAGPMAGLSGEPIEIPHSSGDIFGYTQLRPRPIEHFVSPYDGATPQNGRGAHPQPEHSQNQAVAPEHLHYVEDPQQFRQFEHASEHSFFTQGRANVQPLQAHYPNETQQVNVDPLTTIPHTAGVFSFPENGHRTSISTTSTHPRGSPRSGASLHTSDQQFAPAYIPISQTWVDSKPMTSPQSSGAAPTSASSRSSYPWPQPPAPMVASPTQWTSSAYTPRPELSLPIDHQYYPTENILAQPSSPNSAAGRTSVTSLDYYQYQFPTPSISTSAHLLSAAAVETVDDDYYDVASDEEIDFDAAAVQKHEWQRQQTLGSFLAMNQIRVQDLQVRRYDTFLYEGILDHYRVDEVANPLRNPATARVFAHFISATGPSLSIFERHPRNTSVLFAEGPVPLSQQGLWTYTMPMAALRHQGLLHAMLAMSSLHIARLQGGSLTPSMQHYAWSLKRIHKAVGNPKSRLQLTTMAASMLLGFYEVMAADHMKWNMHLAGSRQLFVETDFVGMTREVCRLKAEKAARQRGRTDRYNSEEPLPIDDLLDQIPDIDERFVSHLVGRQVRYHDYGRIEPQHSFIPPELDLNKFEILKDLYFWYLRQDAYQSIVSGNPLLLDINRWANCPPRAPLGRADAVYGTFDHLLLLLGRIADFAARDRERKLKQMEANGGQWRPAPGMNIPRPPQAPGRPTGAAAPPAMPEFYGMAPAPRANVQMPSSYTPVYDPGPTPQGAQRQDEIDWDLQAATQNALDEYGSIRAALHTFSTSLGEAFEPLSSEYQTPMDTPFGPALFYRAFDIGALWSVYNMAVIVAIRSHPHMPPAAHVAAAIAAPETAFFANEIGRIAAGIVPGPTDQPLNPSLGASLNESCMPSFLAAVQFQDPEQRRTTVTRIYSIAKRTGWGSAELIANGIETAWVKAAAAGRGPPYERIARTNYTSNDPRLNGSWEHLDPNATPNEMDDNDRRLVKMKATARLNWAIGIMGVEDDVAKIRLSDG
ncbi:unnamed protein product [Zymoseptoria tritici ST99CH_1E4]|nr:unnamed protein product [Zymoseptoria tritici ST99CH_1E4]